MRKTFDCIDMKSDIQRQTREEYAGIPEEEAHRLEWEKILWEKILADPVLGPFVKTARVARRRSAA